MKLEKFEKDYWKDHFERTDVASELHGLAVDMKLLKAMLEQGVDLCQQKRLGLDSAQTIVEQIDQLQQHGHEFLECVKEDRK